MRFGRKAPYRDSAELLREYLTSVLRLLTRDAALSDAVTLLLQDKTTFRFIRQFLKSNHTHPKVTIPIEWYEES